MAVKTLENLVLRGVAVLRGGKAVELRLGASVANTGAPEIRLPMPLPSAGCPTQPPYEGQFDPFVPERHDTDESVLGAGRSRRSAGRISPRGEHRAWSRTTATAWPGTGPTSAPLATRAGSTWHAAPSLSAKTNPAMPGSLRMVGGSGFGLGLLRGWITGC